MATTPRTYLRSHPIAMPTHQQHFQCQLKSRNKTNKKHKNFGNNKNTLENIAKNLWNEQKHHLEHHLFEGKVLLTKKKIQSAASFESYTMI